LLLDKVAVFGVTIKETALEAREKIKKNICILACILLWACSLVSGALGAFSFSALSPTIRLQLRLICNYKEYLRLTFP
jgi:hypothetical protein